MVPILYTYDPEDQLMAVTLPAPDGAGGEAGPAGAVGRGAEPPAEPEGGPFDPAQDRGAAPRQITFRYDGLGRRIEKTVNGVVTRYVYDQEDIIAAETVRPEPVEGRPTVQWVVHGPGIDDPLLVLRDLDGDGIISSFERWGYHADGLGSIVALTGTDRAGNVHVVERYRYDSFGQPTILGPGPDGVLDTGDDVKLTCSAEGNSFLFTGREYDCETGLHYYRARYYDPRTGRFLQEDPLSMTVLNLYAYAAGNPVTLSDPFGLLPDDFRGRVQVKGFGLTVEIEVDKETIRKAFRDQLSKDERFRGGFTTRELDRIAAKGIDTLTPEQFERLKNATPEERDAIIGEVMAQLKGEEGLPKEDRALLERFTAAVERGCNVGTGAR